MVCRCYERRVLELHTPALCTHEGQVHVHRALTAYTYYNPADTSGKLNELSRPSCLGEANSALTAPEHRAHITPKHQVRPQTANARTACPQPAFATYRPQFSQFACPQRMLGVPRARLALVRRRPRVRRLRLPLARLHFVAPSAAATTQKALLRRC